MQWTAILSSTRAPFFGKITSVFLRRITSPWLSLQASWVVLISPQAPGLGMWLKPSQLEKFLLVATEVGSGMDTESNSSQWETQNFYLNCQGRESYLFKGQVKVLSCSVLPNSLRPHGLYSHQAPLSMGFSRQEYWSPLPCPSPGVLPHPGIDHRSPKLWADSSPFEPPGKPFKGKLAFEDIGLIVLAATVRILICGAWEWWKAV